ncbi:hypothetical protein C5F59_029175 [Streptomyces sp. QL37]|uniref:hypothetical protein n=1 Tax=Streptomyces sp. QL37 TaxID=2093747 RepID=UPI000CF1ED64|nr:hypothetical protein [Streptomyces sp. QL37]PPQ60369.1 hypothetical protein C5F59_29600 [Streptomyces sp. QL37]
MGWTVLYIAFGIVALWLLGEVLLQYKARLRWRLLAFAGFLGVVLGVLIPSVLVIVLGAIAFATGQTYVTLSFRRGFSTGWAIGGSPGESRRRRGARGPESRKPTLEVSGLEYEGDDRRSEAAPAAVYAPEPLPDDTGQYGIYTDPVPAGREGQDQHGEPHPQHAGYDPYNGYGGPAGQDLHGGQGGYGGQDTHQDQGAYAGQYDYGTDQAGYASYSDPYDGTGTTTTGTGQYAAYDSYGSGYDPSYGAGQQPSDPYAGQYTDTPPGGVWVPQQRESDQHPPLPPEAPVQPAPYGNGYDTGQNEQYRY